MRGLKFMLKVMIANHNSPLSTVEPIKKGAFGSVYFTKIFD